MGCHMKGVQRYSLQLLLVEDALNVGSESSPQHGTQDDVKGQHEC